MRSARTSASSPTAFGVLQHRHARAVGELDARGTDSWGDVDPTAPTALMPAQRSPRRAKRYSPRVPHRAWHSVKPRAAVATFRSSNCIMQSTSSLNPLVIGALFRTAKPSTSTRWTSLNPLVIGAMFRTKNPVLLYTYEVLIPS